MSASHSTLKERIQSDMKSALKGGEKSRLGAIRLILAAIKQREVDERILLDDAQVLAVLDKMLKQRRDSINQYRDAGRTDLASVEEFEVSVIQDYLPEALSEQAVEALIREAMMETSASGIKDLGKVMALLKPKMQGRADLAAVSAKVRGLLAG